MKKITIIFLTSIIFLLSCNDFFLDKGPLDKIADDAVWNDEALVEAYLVNLYYQMSYFANESPGVVWDGDSWYPVFAVNEVSDECMPQWRDASAFYQFYNYKFGNLKINGGLLEWWGYAPIRSINDFIEHLPETPLSEDMKAVRMAEARFLRAFSYFAMVKRYGGVPLITKVQNFDNPNDEIYPARNKEQEIYDFVIREIDEIVGSLLETTDLGRPSKYAALALKCRAALYAGSIAQFGKVQLDGIVGIPAEEASGYYQKAYDAANIIIKSNQFKLYNEDPDKVTNFRNVFLVDDNNSENIFVKPHDETNALEGGNGWCVDFMQCPRPQGWNRGNLDGAYLELAEAFEYTDGRPGTLDRAAIQKGLWTTKELWKDKDPRFFATIYTQDMLWKGDTVDFYKGLLLPDGSIQTIDSYNGVLAHGDQDVDGTCLGILKYLDENHDNMAGINSGWPTSAQDWRIFRYGEILLNFAEAAFELGKSGEAMEAVNQIRERAGITSLTSIDRNKIRHERRVELAFEGHRYWDVRRWRTAVNDLSVSSSALRYILDYNSYKSGERKFKLMVIEQVDGAVSTPLFREENYYLPITLARTSNNPNLVENPGYK